MANRPVYAVSNGVRHFSRIDTEFQFFRGLSAAQKKRCVESLHQAYLSQFRDEKVLEVSSVSENPLGVALSAFNLMIEDAECGMKYSVECAFQAGKRFEHGGPYTDLLAGSSIAAKKDERLKTSGRIIGFTYKGEDFNIIPKTAFYNWLYMKALHSHPELASQIVEYDAFTDISFNPQKSINCQAEAAAIYVSLYRKGLLEEAMSSSDSFLRIIYGVQKK